MKTNNQDDENNMKKPNRVSINANYNVNKAFLYDDIFTVANPNEQTNIEPNRSGSNKQVPKSNVTNILGNVNMTRETLLPANSFAQREAPITQNYEITDNTSSNNTLNHNMPSIEFNNRNGRKSQKCSIYNPFVFVPLLLVICLIIFASVASITLAILYAKSPNNQSTTSDGFFSTQNPTNSTSTTSTTSTSTPLTSTTQSTTTTTNAHFQYPSLPHKKSQYQVQLHKQASSRRNIKIPWEISIAASIDVYHTGQTYREGGILFF
jgi:hypothetical protein